MTIVVNGSSRAFETGVTLADVVAGVRGDTSGKGVAAALNGEVVTRSEWPVTSLADGDRVEVLTASQGG
jgi:sulfur carrier protein